MELAKTLIKRKYEVVIIEADKDKAEMLANKLDCLVINADASDPDAYRELNVKETDIFIALTNDDRVNIVAALTAKSMGIQKIIVRIENPEYNDILLNNGIRDVFNPNTLIINHIMSILEERQTGLEYIPQSTIRLQIYYIPERLAGLKIKDLDIDSDKARIVAVYRGEDAFIPDDDTVLEPGDHVLVVYRVDYQSRLEKVFQGG